jgi:hypothetical protein
MWHWFRYHESSYVLYLILAHIWDAFGFALKSGCDTLPVQNRFGACGRSADPTQTVRTITRTFAIQRLLWSGPRMVWSQGPYSLQYKGFGSHWNIHFLKLLWVDRGRSGLLVRTVRNTNKYLAHFPKHDFEMILTLEFGSVVNSHANATSKCSMRH